MSTRDTQTLNKITAALANYPNASELFTRFDVSPDSLTVRLPIIGSSVAIRAVADPRGGYLVGAVGLNPTATRWLHDVLVIRSTLKFAFDGKEIQVLRKEVSVDALHKAVVDAAYLVLRLRKQEESGDFPAEETVGMYWSSGVLNFGDWAGPHIVQALTGKQPVQINRPGLGPRVLYTVGSILGWIKRNNVDVWGSGLMRPLTTEEIVDRSKLTGIKIHAVRGRNTKKHLETSLGWDVPEVFGDPALLLPDFISPPLFRHGRIACVPHHIHKARVVSGRPTALIVDARGDVRDVVSEISGATAVISSSLHGLIVAQAYQVPWVWLDVTDNQLGGGEFKFEDFFTCLDRNRVTKVQVTKEELATLDFESLAAKASLPTLNIDLQLLRNALPVKPAARPVTMNIHP